MNGKELIDALFDVVLDGDCDDDCKRVADEAIPYIMVLHRLINSMLPVMRWSEDCYKHCPYVDYCVKDEDWGADDCMLVKNVKRLIGE